MTHDDRVKKLRFRAWRRGFRELDLLMGAFADQHLARLDDQGLDAFEALLGENDQDVYAWIIGQSEPPVPFRTEVFDLIRSFRFFARNALGEQGG